MSDQPNTQQVQSFNGSEAFGYWPTPALIAPNNFRYKSLSSWSFNITVGCSHGCRFCYVPSAATIRQKSRLQQFGITDPDAEWGKYALLRPFDQKRFMESLKRAEQTPISALKAD